MAVCIEAIGRNIKQYRREKKMTQENMAQCVGITPLNYGRLERGERNVSLEQLDRIAEILEVPILKLLVGAFPDEQIEQAEDEQTAFVCTMGHLSKSLDARQKEIVLGLSRLMIRAN